MARVKRAVNAQKKRRTILKASKGYRGQRSRLYRKAKEQQLHSLTYAYRDRRARKGEFRKLWISRINAAARANDITYNRLIQGLKAAGVEVDRKNLAEIAISDPAAFSGNGYMLLGLQADAIAARYRDDSAKRGGPMMLLASPTLPGAGLNPACAAYGSSVLILPEASLDAVHVSASLCTQGDINQALLYATVSVVGTHAAVWTTR